MMIIENKFDIGQTVYLKTDVSQSPYIVTRLNITANGLSYGLNSGPMESWHFDFEISEEKNTELILQ